MEKRIALFEVKALDPTSPDADPHGEFEAILSVPTVDRDGEVIDGKAFEPLPAEIPIHKFHDFSSPVATAVPFYEGDVLKARGRFDPDPDSQAIRAKIGRSIRYMSVGFMAATRSDKDGTPHITRAELLEASFVSVPSNREAAILAVKGHNRPTPPSEPGVRLRVENAGLHGKGAKVVLDDEDISRHVSRVTIDLDAADVTRATLVLFVKDLQVDGKARVATSTDSKSPAATDPEQAAAPAAASPADVAVGQVHVELARLRAALLTQ